MLEPTSCSVLMVDDNAAMREAIARSLARRGCRVTTAVSGADGLEALQQQPFDVVVTDLNMPEHGGLWLWRQALMLRPQLRGRFVMLASEPLPEPRSLSLFLESERFLLKPLSLDTLWRQIDEIVAATRNVSAGGRAGQTDSPARNSDRA